VQNRKSVLRIFPDVRICKAKKGKFCKIKFQNKWFQIIYRENSKIFPLQVVKKYHVFYIKVYDVLWHIILVY